MDITEDTEGAGNIQLNQNSKTIFDRDSSPARKKFRQMSVPEEPTLTCRTPTKKRDNIRDMDSPSKRRKLLTPTKPAATSRRLNFIAACQQVSSREYHNCVKRFGVSTELKPSSEKVMPVSGCKQEAFNIDYNAHMWCEALDICQNNIISPNTCLSPNIMQSICEIILNAHENPNEGYTIKYLLERCRHILNLNTNTHISNSHIKICKTFQQFLKDPLPEKSDSYSDRAKYDSTSGIFRYCLKRIYEEIQSADDSPVVDKFAELPPNIARRVQQIHWKREKFEILETMDRSDRLERLFLVIDCIVDLLQKDLSIWFQRYSLDPVNHIMRPHKPLIAFVLWQNPLLTGSIGIPCQLIFKTFASLVSNRFKKQYITTYSKLINLIAEVTYMCEKDCEKSFPNTGKFIYNVSLELFLVLNEYSHSIVTDCLEIINPPYLKYLIGEMFLKDITKLKTKDTLSLIKIILKDYKWDNVFILDTAGSAASYKNRKITFDKLCRIYKKVLKFEMKSDRSPSGPNEDSTPPHQDVHLLKILYLTLQSYVNAYALQDIHEHLEVLNSDEILMEMEKSPYKQTQKETAVFNFNHRSKPKEKDFPIMKLSEGPTKQYRLIFSSIKDLIIIFADLKETNPGIAEVFKAIKLLELT